MLAELGSLSVEFTRLAQITHTSKYYDAIARITNELESWQNNTKMPGLWPMMVDASGCKTADTTETTQIDHSLLNGPGNYVPQALASPSLNDNGTSGTEEPSSLDRDGLEDASKEKTDTEKGESSDSTTDRETTAPPSIDRLSKSKVGTIKRQLLDEATELSTDSTETTSVEMPDCEAQGLASPPYSDSESFTLGGQADSTYEYLIKEYMLLGGVEDVYRTMYERAVETTKKYLLFRPMLPDDRDILLSGLVRTRGDLENPDDISLKPEGTHLTCFVGGMFAIGAKIFDRKEDLGYAQKLTDGCVWAYGSTVTGIQPEQYLVAPCEGLEKCAWNETRYYELLDPNRAFRHPTEENEQVALRFNASQDAANQKLEGTETAEGDVPRETGKPSSNAGSSAQADVSKESKANPKVNSTIQPDDGEESEDSSSEGVSPIRAAGPKESNPKVGSLARRQLEAIENEAPLKQEAGRAGKPSKEDLPKAEADDMKSNTEKEKEVVDDPKESTVNNTSETEDYTGYDPTTEESAGYVPTTEEYAKGRIRDERLPLGMIAIQNYKYILRYVSVSHVCRPPPASKH